MIGIVAFAYFGDSPELLETPKINDSISVEESVSISPNIDADTLDLQEKVTVEKTTDVPYWIDEDGKKHYTIEARDSPTLEE